MAQFLSLLYWHLNYFLQDYLNKPLSITTSRNPNPRENQMAGNQQPAVCQLCQQQDIAAKDQAGKRQGLSWVIWFCSPAMWPRAITSSWSFYYHQCSKEDIDSYQAISSDAAFKMMAPPQIKIMDFSFFSLPCTFSAFSSLPFLTCLRDWG